jgi:hypothetical protein
MINQQNTSNKVIQELQNQVSEKIIASFDMVAQDRSNYFAKNPYQNQRPSTYSTNLIAISKFITAISNHIRYILAPFIACGEGVGGGVLVPGLMTICCKTVPC